MWRHAILGSLAALFVSGSAKAESWLDTGSRGFQTCMEHLMDQKGAKSALEADGWRFEGIQGFGRAYSKEGRRIIVIHGQLRPRKEACVLMVRKMTAEQAVALAQTFIKQAKSVSTAEKTEGGSVAEWTAIYRGVPTRFAAVRPRNIGINHGAAIFVTEE